MGTWTRHDKLMAALAAAYAVICMAANLMWHDVPWGQERDGYFLVGTATEELTLATHPLGFILPLKVLTAATGNAFRSAQFLAAIFSALFLFASYKCVQRIFASDRVAMGSAVAALAMHPLLLMSLLGTSDVLANLLTITTLAVAIPLVEHADTRRLAMVGVLAGLVFATKFTGLFAVIALAFALLVSPRDGGRRLRDAALVVGMFFATVAAFAVVTKVLAIRSADAVGWRVNSLETALNLLFHINLIPAVDFARDGVAGSLIPLIPMMAFRFLVGPIEWTIELLRMYTPIPFLALFFAWRWSRDEARRRRTFVLIFATAFVVQCFYCTFAYDDISRYLLWLFPLAMGAFFRTLGVLIDREKTERRAIVRATAFVVAAIFLFAVGGRAWTNLRREALFEDWTTQGDRPHVPRSAFEEAARVIRGEMEIQGRVAATNPTYGLADPNLVYYSWFFEGTRIYLHTNFVKGVEYFHESLRRFLCHTTAKTLLYDPGDTSLQIRWEGYREDAGDLSRFAPPYLIPARQVGPLEIYRVVPDVCEISLPNPEDEPGVPPPPPPGEAPPPPPDDEPDPPPENIS
ncbi:MAG: glycosyltransferase family 39 protein [Deltaproteobacteria bacterium]|nr:glycosyltransferase family 39 protein [Deltaproteobacteria bacterium]